MPSSSDLLICLRDIKRSGREDALHVEEVERIHDFKTILQCNLPRFFKGHKDPLGFRFRKFQGETQMHVRMHGEEAWVPNQQDCQYPREHLGTGLGFLCIQVHRRVLGKFYVIHISIHARECSNVHGHGPIRDAIQSCIGLAHSL